VTMFVPGNTGGLGGRGQGPQLPKDLATLIKYISEGGLMTPNQKGDPIYVSSLPRSGLALICANRLV